MATSYTHFGMGHMRGFGGDVERVLDHAGDFEPGVPVFMTGRRDKGLKLASVMKNLSGSTVAAGSVVSRRGDNNGLTSAGTITAGTTTTITTSGLTAGDHREALIWITDDAGAAGAAPESEASVIKDNTATLITVYPEYPFSAAVAASDTAQIFATIGMEACADGDKNYVCMGVVLPDAGIADNEYGWIQSFGICGRVKMVTDFIAVTSEPLVCGTGGLTGAAGTSDGGQLQVGTCIGAETGDVANDQVLAFMTCGHLPIPAVSIDASL